MDTIKENFEEKTAMNEVWDDLKKMREALSGKPLEQMKQYINETMSDDVEDLKKMFVEDFKDFPKDDPLRMEVLQTLGELGIIIYH
jgi:hypothetical protein